MYHVILRFDVRRRLHTCVRLFYCVICKAVSTTVCRHICARRLHLLCPPRTYGFHFCVSVCLCVCVCEHSVHDVLLAEKCIRLVCEKLTLFPYGQDIVGNIFYRLSDDIVRFEVEVQVSEKCRKCNTYITQNGFTTARRAAMTSWHRPAKGSFVRHYSVGGHYQNVHGFQSRYTWRICALSERLLVITSAGSITANN